MTEAYEVPEPILNSPFEELLEHWYIREGEAPQKRDGRPAGHRLSAARGAQRLASSMEPA